MPGFRVEGLGFRFQGFPGSEFGRASQGCTGRKMSILVL